LTHAASLVIVHHLKGKIRTGWLSVSLRWLDGVSCLSASWYFGVILL